MKRLLPARKRQTQTATASPPVINPIMNINPIMSILLASQLLAERGAERAYQQGVQSLFSQLKHRGLETSGISEGALTNLASQFASKLADIRTQLAQNFAETQLRALENLLQIAASREADALQIVAARARAAQPLLQSASTQMQNIISAFAGLSALPALQAPTAPTAPALPPLSVNPDAWLNVRLG